MTSMKSSVTACFLSAWLVAVSADAASLTVTSIADAGGSCPGASRTLRQAIATAVAGDTITFSLPANSAITLTGGELLIRKTLTINGPGANLLTVQRSNAPGTPAFGIFDSNQSGFTLTISDLTMANGNTSVGGGGIRNNATLTLANVTISSNSASGSTGGGIYNNAGTLTVTNSTISGNSASSGGGLYNQAGMATITNSTISGNSVSSVGGGMVTLGGTVTITNSTISGNSSSGTAPLGFGGGIWGSVTARNTIIALNTASASPDVSGVLTSQGHNLIGNTSGMGSSGTGIGDQLNVDPLLGPLQDNGGPTKTRALLSGSPAIEGGDSSGSNTDQRGLARPVDSPAIANATGGDGSDIGAYEVQADVLPGCNNVNRIVNNNNDSGTDSLRDVIAHVCAGSTITFAPNVTGAINLTSTELLINKRLTISGPGANLLRVQRSTAPGTPAFRIFNIGPASVNATISGLTIANGNVLNSGGGISTTGTLTLTNATISGNMALNGGGIFSNFGTVTITNSTLSGNTVSSNILAGSGGGMFNSGGKVTITNSTISGNAANGPGGNSDSGGGIITNVGTVTLTNSTISGNSGDLGGGVRNINGGTVRSKNTIIALNTSASGPDVNGPLTSEGFNLIGNASGAAISPAQFSDQIGVTPAQLNLGPLQDNGGPTQTHALLSGSFAIDKGTSNGLTGQLATDQRGSGFQRAVDDSLVANVTGGDGTDIGAFERTGFTDDTLTLIRAVHITELRSRVDAQRTRFGLAAFGWTDASLTAGMAVMAVHMTQLRTALQEAYTAASQSPPTFTDSPIVPGITSIRMVHIQELRDAVLFLEGS